jgi:hypothetical protein
VEGVTPEDLEEYRRACVRIEPEAIQDEYVRTPSDLAYWSEMHSNVFREWQLAKFAREQEWGAAITRSRATLSSASVSGRGPTVDQVDAHATNDEAYVAAKRNEIYLEAERQRLLGMVEAIRTKKDMLVSLGAHIRAEMERDPQVNERERE